MTAASQIVSLALPPGYKLHPEARRRSLDPKNPTKPTVLRTVVYPGGIEEDHAGRTPNEAVGNAVAQAWMHWFSEKLEKLLPPENVRGADLTQIVEAVQVPPARLEALLPPGYEFLNPAPLAGGYLPGLSNGYSRTIAPPCRQTADYIRGTGPSAAAACALALSRAWDHYHAVQLAEAAGKLRGATVEKDDRGTSRRAAGFVSMTMDERAPEVIAEDEAPDLTRQGLQLPPGYRFECAMACPAVEGGSGALRSFAVVTPTGGTIEGRAHCAGHARVLAALRAWARYEQGRRLAHPGNGLPRKLPILPPGWHWIGAKEDGRGWTVELRKATGENAWESHHAHAPSKHGAVELAQRQCWNIHKSGMKAEAAPTRDELARRLNATVRRHLTTYTVPTTAEGKERAQAFVRILPPNFRYRDAAPVASAPGVAPTIFTDVVYYESGTEPDGLKGYSLQVTDPDAHVAATKVALKAWEEYEKAKADAVRVERPGGVGSMGEEAGKAPSLPEGYSYQGGPQTDDGKTWAQAVQGPEGVLVASARSPESALAFVALKAQEQHNHRRRTLTEALRRYSMFEADLIGVRGNKFGLPSGWVHVGGSCETADDTGYFRQARTLATNPDGSWENVVAGLGRTPQEATNDSVVRAWAAISRGGLGVELPDGFVVMEARRLAEAEKASQSAPQGTITARAEVRAPDQGSARGGAPGANAGASDNVMGCCPLTDSPKCPANQCPPQCPQSGSAREKESVALDPNAGDELGGGSIACRVSISVWC